MRVSKNNKIIDAFADTHGRHREYHYDSKATDILVCAGDVCNGSDEEQLQDFFLWFAQQPAKYKLFVPGNHDLPFDLEPEHALQYIPTGVTYIEQGEILLDGIKFYILPARMGLHKETAPGHLPADIDILVTHCPPKDILDGDSHCGCPILRALVEKAKPKIHIFGHCHQTAGKRVRIGGTEFWNVAVCATS